MRGDCSSCTNWLLRERILLPVYISSVTLVSMLEHPISLLKMSSLSLVIDMWPSRCLFIARIGRFWHYFWSAACSAAQMWDEWTAWDAEESLVYRVFQAKWLWDLSSCFVERCGWSGRSWLIEWRRQQVNSYAHRSMCTKKSSLLTYVQLYALYAVLWQCWIGSKDPGPMTDPNNSRIAVDIECLHQ